ncbi:MAG: SPOR domain-containing protein [Candidatus Dactylopiibacterium sp.]|nr:SPOR domain-containing protein [Candidatus Dactylopiibacterium sp.]
MPVFRPLFYLLLALNIALAVLGFLIATGHDAPWQTPGEPERTARQLAAERIVLVTDASAPAAGPAVAPLPVASEPVAAPAAAEQSAAVRADAPTCIAFRNLGAADVALIRTLAEPLGARVSLSNSGVLPTSYWVNIPPAGGREGASQRGDALARAGVTDYIIVREAGPNQFAISLGLFHNEEAARRLVAQLQKKDVRNVRITARDNTGTAARSEIRGPADAVSALHVAIRGRLRAAEDDACRAPG